jgi:integrase/recombinase XerD
MKKIVMANKENLTVQNAFDLFIRKCRVKNLSTSTIKAYEDKLKRFIEYVEPETQIKDITSDVVDSYILDLREDTDINDITIATLLRHLRAFVYYCQECGYVEKYKIVIPKAEKKIKETYTIEELERLLERPNTDSFSEFKTWAFENYLIATGNRLSTALNIKIGDIDFENGIIRMSKTKNRRQQIIPLSNSLANVLKDYLEVRGGSDDDYLFCNQYGEKASERSYQLLVQKYNIKRNVNCTSCHAFRHSFAKQWIMNSGDIARLKTILGHANLSTTNEYLQMFGQDLQMDFEKFNPLDNIKSSKTTIKM